MYKHLRSGIKTWKTRGSYFVRTNSFQYTWVRLSRITVRKLKHEISKVTSTVMVLNYITLVPAIYQIKKCDFLQLPYKEIVNAFSN